MAKLAARKSSADGAPAATSPHVSLSEAEHDALRLLRDLTREAPRLAPVRPDQANRYVRP